MQSLVQYMYFSTWNVSSLVDNEGTVETARLSFEDSEPEDRRIDLVIRELNWYNIKVAALQETKWLGNHVYHVGKSAILTTIMKHLRDVSQDREEKV